MKHLWNKISLLNFLSLFYFVMCTTYGQEKVAFIHGLGSNGTIWTNGSINGYNMISRLQQDGWNMTAVNPSRATTGSFAVQANLINNYVNSIGFTNSIAVTHSLGAPVTRTYMVKNGVSKINRIITLAGANDVTPLAMSIYNGNASLFLSQQTQALVLVPVVFSTYFSPPTWMPATLDALASVVSSIASGSITDKLELRQNDATLDLSGNGPGFDYLYGVQENFLRVGIIAQETDRSHEFYRLAATVAKYNRSTGNDFQEVISYAFEYGAIYATIEAIYYDRFGFLMEASIMITIHGEQIGCICSHMIFPMLTIT